MGVPPSGSGCQPSPSAASATAPASSRSGIPNALCDCERSHNGLGAAGRVCDCLPDLHAYDDYDAPGCGQCDGEGWVHGCSWEWQCDTYDPEYGECLCTRRCEFCNSPKRAA